MIWAYGYEKEQPLPTNHSEMSLDLMAQRSERTVYCVQHLIVGKMQIIVRFDQTEGPNNESTYY